MEKAGIMEQRDAVEMEQIRESSTARRSKEEVLGAIRSEAFIPIVRVNSREHALCAAEGIVRAGFSLIEITLTIPDALGVIEEVVTRFGKQLIVGAGTVLDTESCRSAIAAGASFVVSPSTDPVVIKATRSSGVVSMPGAQTPTEIVTGWKAGADLVKIFPAGLAGGPAYIRALRGPFPEIPFVPSNGIDHGNAAHYLAAGATAVGVGGPIFHAVSLARGDVEAIARDVRSFAEALRSGGIRP